MVNVCGCLIRSISRISFQGLNVKQFYTRSLLAALCFHAYQQVRLFHTLAFVVSSSPLLLFSRNCDPCLC